MHPQSSIVLPFDEPRFWSKVNFDGPLPEHHPELGPCWLWTRARTKHGYANYGVSAGVVISGHRYAYRMTHGPIPNGLLICHHCDVKHCVRPSHLFLGTNRDNLSDMAAKGRSCIGPKNGMAKTNWHDVHAMRERYDAGGITCNELGDEYNLAASVIGDIVFRRSWRE